MSENAYEKYEIGGASDDDDDDDSDIDRRSTPNPSDRLSQSAEDMTSRIDALHAKHKAITAKVERVCTASLSPSAPSWAAALG